jgi:ethanolamine-phosphate cytidylyltransferase
MSQQIVYVQGSYDLLHHGHLRRLAVVKKRYPNSFLYVGLWDDFTIKGLKSASILPLQERVLMVLSCKYVDDVVIGAPFIIKQDLVKSLGISKIITFSDTLEDKNLSQSFDSQF